jgi:hypothetical protein
MQGETITIGCNTAIWEIAVVYHWLGSISAAFGIITGIVHVVYCWLTNKKIEMSSTLGKMLVAYFLPPTIIMGLSSIDPASLLGCVSDIRISILLGAAAVIWITFTVLFPNGIASRSIEKLGEMLGRNPPPAAARALPPPATPGAAPSATPPP